jgi:hypothetical protein
MHSSTSMLSWYAHTLLTLTRPSHTTHLPQLTLLGLLAAGAGLQLHLALTAPAGQVP